MVGNSYLTGLRKVSSSFGRNRARRCRYAVRQPAMQLTAVLPASCRMLLLGSNSQQEEPMSRLLGFVLTMRNLGQETQSKDGQLKHRDQQYCYYR